LFEKALPNYDKDAVYVSNMKSIFSWYNILLENNLIDLEIKKEESEINDSETSKDDKE
jgi:hypothetical protein